MYPIEAKREPQVEEGIRISGSRNKYYRTECRLRRVGCPTKVKTSQKRDAHIQNTRENIVKSQLNHLPSL